MWDESAVATVMSEVTRERMLAAVCGLVNIASPTGAEREVANWATEYLLAEGVQAFTQVIDERQANTVGMLAGPAQAESVLLYAPLDTFTTGNLDFDLPWAARAPRPDLLPKAEVYGDLVVGLAAGNPKGHAAAVLVTVAALARSGVSLPTEVVAGLGAGGMPSFAVPGAGVAGRENTGHGVGANFMLERGFVTDHAVIAKPGWTVSHEEVGLVWIDVDVPGEHTYVGSRHRIPYLNSATVAARVIQHLENWFAAYAEAHEVGTMCPQGVVSSVLGGFPHLAASTSALVRLRLDLRLTTQQSAPQVVREVNAELASLGEELGVELHARQIASVPATRTEPASPIIRATTAAWEQVAGQPHEPILANSGATDANILRLRGVPTARVGMPKVTSSADGGPVDFSLGMNSCDLTELRRLVEILVRTVLALGRPPNE